MEKSGDILWAEVSLLNDNIAEIKEEIQGYQDKSERLAIELKELEADKEKYIAAIKLLGLDLSRYGYEENPPEEPSNE